MPPHITSAGHLDRRARALDNDDFFNARRVLDGVVSIRLHCDILFRAAYARILRNDCLTLRIIDSGD